MSHAMIEKAEAQAASDLRTFDVLLSLDGEHVQTRRVEVLPGINASRVLHLINRGSAGIDDLVSDYGEISFCPRSGGGPRVLATWTVEENYLDDAEQHRAADGFDIVYADTSRPVAFNDAGKIIPPESLN